MLNSLPLLVLHIMIAASVLFDSRLYQAFGLFSQPLLLGTIALAIVMFAGLSLLAGRVLAVYLALLGLSLIVFQAYVFTRYDPTSFNVNTVFQFVTVLAFMAFAYMAHTGRFAAALQAVTVWSLAYTAIYVTLSLLHAAGALPPSIANPLILFDAERGTRLYLHPGPVALVFFLLLSRLLERASLLNFALFALPLAAIALAESRALAVAFIAMAGLKIIGLSARTISTISIAVFGCVTAVLLVSLLAPAFNPFTIFGADSSGTFRAHSFEIARVLLSREPFLGVGIAPNHGALTLLTLDRYFYSSDLGAVGVWFDFGLLGMALYCACIIVCCSFSARAELTNASNTALHLSGCAIGVLGCIAPTIWYGNGLFFALLLAAALTRKALPERQTTPRQNPQTTPR